MSRHHRNPTSSEKVSRWIASTKSAPRSFAFTGSSSIFGLLGKIADLKDADLLQYDHRRDRIEELREELESMVRARG